MHRSARWSSNARGPVKTKTIDQPSGSTPYGRRHPMEKAFVRLGALLDYVHHNSGSTDQGGQYSPDGHHRSICSPGPESKGRAEDLAAT